MDINTMTLEDKVILLKELLDSIEDVIIFGCYGSSAHLNTDKIYIAKEDESFYGVKKDKTLIIGTTLCSG